MKQFQKNNGTTVDSNKDINYSTRYDDRELVKSGTEEEKLDWLAAKISGEIMLSSDNIFKLERLRERYWSDGLEALSDGAMGYYMRYVAGYERIKILSEAFYLPFHPVNNKGELEWQ